MKISDYIIDFLHEKYNVDVIFTVSGGGCIHLIDSLGKNKNVQYIANHHEQCCAIAAEGYARKKNMLGACIVTSGPGGTNALTGTLCSYLDSVPVIVISGQVNKSLTTNYTNSKLRQLGDQEFDIVKVAKSLTKYAFQVNEPEEIKYHLEKACFLATTGRPGPVWLDIPLDVQSAHIDPDSLEGFVPEFSIKSKINYENIFQLFEKCKKPLLIVGNGIRIAGAKNELFEFLEKTEIPVITAVNGNDLVNESYPYYYGRFGTHAQITANKIINESDLVLSVGSRLYVRQIGYNFKDFAKNAIKIYVDIDQNELDKPTLRPDLKICEDARIFLKNLNGYNLKKVDRTWHKICDSLKTEKVLDRHRNKISPVSNYLFIEKLSEFIPNDHDVVTSDGASNVVTMQVLKLKNNQRLITNTGSAPMGYGLSCAIGVSATKQKVLCLEGDGSLHLNIQELQTMKHNNLPIKLILLNNKGYLSIKITQNSFFDGNFVASEESSGVSFPDFELISQAYKIPYFEIKNSYDIDNVLKTFMEKDGPCICQVFTDPNETFEPKVNAKMDEHGKFIPGCLSEIKWSD